MPDGTLRVWAHAIRDISRPILQRIVVAAKAGAHQPWLAEAAADLAQQTGAAVLDGVARRPRRRGALPTPRAEFQAQAKATVDAFLEHLRAAGGEAEGEVRSGSVAPGILLYAEEKDADLIVCGASSKRRVARRVLGSVPVD